MKLIFIKVEPPTKYFGIKVLVLEYIIKIKHWLIVGKSLKFLPQAYRIFNIYLHYLDIHQTSPKAKCFSLYHTYVVIDSLNYILAIYKSNSKRVNNCGDYASSWLCIA